MKNLISGAIARVSSVLKQLQVKQFLTVVLVGFLLLTTNVDSGRNNQAVTNRVNDLIHPQNDSQRPKTTREWNEKARETDDSLVDRVGEIGKESAEAVKDWGKMYPDTAERTAPDIEEHSGNPIKNLFN